MLVKSQSARYPEDFGLRKGEEVYFYYQCIYGDEGGNLKGPVKVSAVRTSPVVRVNAMWLDRKVKVRCHIADTELKKRDGLQQFTKLSTNEGMYFPYSPFGEHVTFHQGSVRFPLDVLFLRDDEIAHIEAETEVGSSDRWSCRDCTGVIEVKGGFCFENEVSIGDRIALFAVAENDLKILQDEKESVVRATHIEKYRDDYTYMPNAVHLISQIADSL